MDKGKSIKTCRLCLETLGPKRPSKTSIDDEAFRTRLNAVSNFMFKDSDQLPSGVCSECADEITRFYTFIEKVRCNQEQLYSSLPSTQVKDEKLESPSRELEFASIKEEQLPDCKAELIQVEVELNEDEDPPISETGEDEHEPTPSPTIDDGEPAEDDRLIKDFFSLKCDTCPESFETWKELQSHAKETHKKKAVLRCCNKAFTVKNKMLYHINTHLKPFKCNECGKGFPDKRTRKLHHDARHSNGEGKPFKCDKCTRSFDTEQILQTHLRYHDRVECSVCQRSLLNVYSLKTHMARVHCNERKFICDVCGKGFKSRGTLNSHSVTHTGLTREDGARCEICHTWVSRKKQLRRHIIEIHQGKEATCDICHKTYSNEKSLATHKGRVHVEEKFECEICGKQFKRHVNLKEHRAGHTGQKLYSCEFCGIEISSNGSLYAHKKNKHPEEWLQAKQTAAKFID